MQFSNFLSNKYLYELLTSEKICLKAGNTHTDTDSPTGISILEKLWGGISFVALGGYTYLTYKKEA
jgi:hypothetical protein